MHDAFEEEAEVIADIASTRAKITPPVEIPDPPQMEYEDITAEVDARMKATSIRKERQRMKEMGLLGSEKRKRNSGASIEGGVDIRGGDGSPPSTRPLKKHKRRHKSNDNEETNSDVNVEPEFQQAMPKQGSGSLEQVQTAPKEAKQEKLSTESKRPANNMDEAEDLDKRERKKKRG
jgi:hypothetical protein